MAFRRLNTSQAKTTIKTCTSSMISLLTLSSNLEQKRKQKSGADEANEKTGNRKNEKRKENEERETNDENEETKGNEQNRKE